MNRFHVVVFLCGVSGSVACATASRADKSPPASASDAASSEEKPSESPESETSKKSGEKEASSPSAPVVVSDEARKATELTEKFDAEPLSCEAGAPRADEICRIAERICAVDSEGGPNVASAETPRAESLAEESSGECESARASCKRVKALVAEKCGPLGR